MGMMLRRKIRTPDSVPMVNGKVVEKAPKKRSLTPNTPTTATPVYTNTTNFTK